jgi:hypothetical protein
MMCRPWHLLIGALITAGVGTSALAQEQAQPLGKPRVAERFSGPIGVIGPRGMTGLDVSVQKWIVNSGTRVAMPRLDRGATFVHLMAGSVAVIGKNGRVTRIEGDRWTVPQGLDETVEAGSDSAVLMVTIVRPH